MGSMSASDAAPLPRLGEVFFDVRGNSRSMRLSWYSDTGVAVLSIWQGGMCTGTFRLAIADLPRMVETLQRGPERQAHGGGATGQAFAAAPVAAPPEPADYGAATAAYPPDPSAYRAGPAAYPPEPAAYPPQRAAYPPEPGGYPPEPAGYLPEPAGYLPEPGRVPGADGGVPDRGHRVPSRLPHRTS